MLQYDGHSNDHNDSWDLFATALLQVVKISTFLIFRCSFSEAAFFGRPCLFLLGPNKKTDTDTDRTVKRNKQFLSDSNQNKCNNFPEFLSSTKHPRNPLNGVDATYSFLSCLQQ